MSGISDSVLQVLTGSNIHSDDFQKTLLSTSSSSVSPDTLSASLFASLVPTVPLYSLSLVHVVNFYLDPSRTRALARIKELSAIPAGSASANKELMQFVWEALREHPFSFFYQQMLISVVYNRP